VRRREPALAVLFDRLRDDALERQRHVGVELHRRQRLAVQDRVEHHGRRAALERLLARGHLVEHEAEREEVRADVQLLAARLLGRHVGHGAHRHAVRGGEDAGFDQARRRVCCVAAASPWPRPKSENLGLLAIGDEDVGRLDVAVQDAARVRGVERVGNLHAEPQQHADLERPAVDLARQRAPFEQLHRDEGAPVVLVHLVDGADVRMVERRRGARLAQEAFDRLRSCARSCGRNLSATLRASFTSSARYTTPMPPAPSVSRMR
jgi:hypothetical protein